MQRLKRYDLVQLSKCKQRQQSESTIICLWMANLQQTIQTSINPLPTSPVAATGLCKDAADRASRQRVKTLTSWMLHS